MSFDHVTGLVTGCRRFPVVALLALLLAAPATGQTLTDQTVQGQTVQGQTAQGVPPLPAPADTAPQYPSNPMPVAVLQGLDKITARIYTFEAPVGQTIGFGTLKVTVRTCRKRPPEYPPESAAYLDIIEQRPGEVPVERFHGWMFASSPALNPLEHPVYDVWVIDCKATSGGSSGPKQ